MDGASLNTNSWHRKARCTRGVQPHVVHFSLVDEG